MYPFDYKVITMYPLNYCYYYHVYLKLSNHYHIYLKLLLLLSCMPYIISYTWLLRILRSKLDRHHYSVITPLKFIYTLYHLVYIIAAYTMIEIWDLRDINHLLITYDTTKIRSGANADTPRPQECTWSETKTKMGVWKEIGFVFKEWDQGVNE